MPVQLATGPKPSLLWQIVLNKPIPAGEFSLTSPPHIPGSFIKNSGLHIVERNSGLKAKQFMS